MTERSIVDLLENGRVQHDMLKKRLIKLEKELISQDQENPSQRITPLM